MTSKPCFFCGLGVLVLSDGGTVERCGHCGYTTPAPARPSTTPPVAAVLVSKADSPEPCARCPEGTAPHDANYALRWRSGSLQYERLACRCSLPDLIEGVLLGEVEEV